MASQLPFIPFAEREEERALPQDLVVQMPGMPMRESMGDGTAVESLADGSVVVDFDGNGSGLPEEDAQSDPQDHDANLAEHISLTDRAVIAQEVIEGVDTDLESRKPWFDLMANGLKRLGVEMNDTDAANLKAFKIAKNVTYPLISEAIVQFQARAIAELFPPQGPVKGQVIGERTRDKEEQSKRVEDYMNYHLTREDKPYFAQTDKMMFLLPVEGSIFRKVCRDYIHRKNVSRMVQAEHFVVPYGATDLETAPRFTHRHVDMSPNDLKKLQASGFYLKDVVLAPPSERTTGQGDETMTEAMDEASGTTEPTNRPEDTPHTIEEQYCELDLPGFEDKDEFGEKTGIKLPYIVHVERESQVVLAIYRNWEEDDQLKTKKIPFAHYRYLPGTGFYGWGLFHAIGGLDAAATALVRTIIVGGAFSSVPGGLKTKDARVAGSIELEPGVYKDTDSTYDELKNAFFTPDFKSPSESLFKVLGLLVEAGQRFMSTTESMVGDAKNTGPVGTTVALIEQGSKVFSGIHKRCHAAAGEEFVLLAKLHYKYTPEEGYPYDVPGASRTVYRQDFDERVDVVPVSDPNIFSSTQRIAISQATLELSLQAPDLFDRREAFRRMLEALRVPDPDGVMPDRSKVERCDPVTENSLAMVGKPIRVFLDQHHDAHIAVHMAQLELSVAQGQPNMELFQSVMIEHISEHHAVGIRLKLMQDIGIPLPPMNLHGDDPKEPVVPPVPPEVENEIAVRAAEMMTSLVQQLRQAQSAQAAAPAQAEQQAQDEAHVADQQRQDEAAARKEERENLKVQSQIDREDAKAGIDPATVKKAQEYLAQRGLDRAITPRQLAVVSRTLGKSFDDVVRVLMAFGRGGQGGGPSPYVMPGYGGERAPGAFGGR